MTGAIVNVPVPPSASFPGNQVANIGHLSTWGNETATTFRILQGVASWEVGLLSNNGTASTTSGAQGS